MTENQKKEVLQELERMEFGIKALVKKGYVEYPSVSMNIINSQEVLKWAWDQRYIRIRSIYDSLAMMADLRDRIFDIVCSMQDKIGNGNIGFKKSINRQKKILRKIVKMVAMRVVLTRIMVEGEIFERLMTGGK